MPSIYQLKSRFQNLLRPFLQTLINHGVTANHVTLFAMVSSLLLGGWLYCAGAYSLLPWLILPLFLFVRMALNAIDGMLAREHNQQSALGAILNEVGDVVSDAALYLPFALLVAQPVWVILAVLLAILTEFIGVLGPMLGVKRNYSGPMGKSDRAFCYGALALLHVFWPDIDTWLGWIFAVTALLMLITCFNRARALLTEQGAHHANT